MSYIYMRRPRPTQGCRADDDHIYVYVCICVCVCMCVCVCVHIYIYKSSFTIWSNQTFMFSETVLDTKAFILNKTQTLWRSRIVSSSQSTTFGWNSSEFPDIRGSTYVWQGAGSCTTTTDTIWVTGLCLLRCGHIQCKLLRYTENISKFNFYKHLHS